MIRDLEQALGYHFRNITLLQNALTHSSYANERWRDSLASNERLEFLGDSILGMITAEHLYCTFPNRPEGELSRIRADLVCETNLAKVAGQLHLGSYLLLGHGEEQGGGRTRESILADAVEAVIAALYLDGGMETARGFIERHILSGLDTESPSLLMGDYKTELQELIQRKSGQSLSYVLLGESGPDHDKLFTSEVCLNGRPIGSGTGRTKKEAEQAAAHAALEALKA